MSLSFQFDRFFDLDRAQCWRPYERNEETATGIITEVSNTDFLQAISVLHTLEAQQAAQAGKLVRCAIGGGHRDREARRALVLTPRL